MKKVVLIIVLLICIIIITLPKSKEVTPLTNRTFSARNEMGWNILDDPKFTIVQDTTAPISPPYVGQALFPKGWKGGYEPIATGFPIKEPITTIYLSFWVKVSSNWQGHPVYNKISYVWIHNNPVVMLGYVGANTNPLRSEVRLQSTPDGAVNLAPNQANIAISRGEWHHWEVLLKANSENNKDGEITWWIDGTLAGKYEAVRFSNSMQEHVWNEVSWRPVWGGGPATVQEDMYMYMDNYYVAGS